MTKTNGAVRLALVLAMVGGPMALAQEAAVDPPAVGLNLQTNVAVRVAFQAKDNLFAGTEKFANGASDVTEINLDPNTMGMVSEKHGPDAQLAKKMKMMSIHTYKYDKPGMYRQEDVDAYRKKLEDGSWHCSIHVRNKNGSTDICSRSSGENNEMVILAAEPQKLTFIHMSGNMSLDELDQMSGNANGMSHRVRPAPAPPTPPTPSTPGVAPVAPVAPAPPR